jgi:hypothetical protein
MTTLLLISYVQSTCESLLFEANFQLEDVNKFKIYIHEEEPNIWASHYYWQWIDIRSKY